MKEKKKKLKVWQILLILFGSLAGAVAIAFFALVFFIMFKDDNSAPTDTTYEEPTTTIYEQMIRWDNGEDDVVQADLTPVPVKLNDSALADFENYLSKIEVDYDYAEAYNIDEALKELENIKPPVTKHAHDVRVNGKLDADSFYKHIKANNKKRMQDDNMTFYEEYSNKDLKNYCKLIVDAINDIYAKNPDLDIDSVCCYLYDLTILNRIGSLDFAAVEIEIKNLHFNKGMLESWGSLSGNENMDTEVMYHEMIHLFQVSCPCNENDGEMRVGVGHNYDKMEINPVAWYWLVEASAEMNACEHLNMDYMTYKAKIGYADTLNFLLNMNGTKQTANIQDVSFTKDINNVFKMFGINTEAEKREFIKMMYSLDIMQENPSSFQDWYMEKYNVDLSSDNDAQNKLYLNVKEDILLSLTKIFYRNLAREVNSGQATVQDMYYLIRLFEADIDRHLSNQTIGYLIYFKDFYPAYLEIQKEFFNVVSKENSISSDKLKADFENYSMKAKDGDKVKSPNCSLGFMTAEQKNAVLKFCKDIYKKGYPSMEKANSLCREWLVKAPYDELVFKE